MKKQDLCTQGNPYGYRYNVNHPWVNPIYREYSREIGVPYGFALTDLQRRGFDLYMDRLLENIQREGRK